MSNQTIDAVIGVVVSSFARDSTIDEHIHRYIVQLDEYMTSTNRSVIKGTLNTFEGDCPLTRMCIRPSIFDTIIAYLKTRRGSVPTTFQHTDWTTLVNESTAFEEFLNQHMYTRLCELEAMGFDRDVLQFTLAQVSGVINSSTCCELWDSSRKLAGRSDVSFGVFRAMYDGVACQYIQKCINSRVRLSDAERQEAIYNAMRTKFLFSSD
jgi:hypothetical protein